jgi:hypothetical protein
MHPVCMHPTRKKFRGHGGSALRGGGARGHGGLRLSSRGPPRGPYTRSGDPCNPPGPAFQVAPGAEARVRVNKTYEDAKSYYVEEDGTRGRGPRCHSIAPRSVLNEGISVGESCPRRSASGGPLVRIWRNPFHFWELAWAKSIVFRRMQCRKLRRVRRTRRQPGLRALAGHLPERCGAPKGLRACLELGERRGMHAEPAAPRRL